MKTLIYLIALLMTSLLMSCMSIDVTKKDKEGNVSKVSGWTTKGIETIDAVTRQNIGEGQRNVLDAEADAIENESKGRLAIDLSVAHFVDSLAATLRFGSENAGELAEIVDALARRDLFSKGFNNINSQYLGDRIQMQVMNQMIQEQNRKYYDSRYNPWW